MKLIWAFLSLLVGAIPLQAAEAEHQRVGVTHASDHHWEGTLTTTLIPWSAAVWEFEVAPKLAYEYQQSWGASVSVPYRWSSRPEAPVLVPQWGDSSFSASWSAGEPRWRVALTWLVPVMPATKPTSTIEGQVGLSLIRDPVVWAAAASVACPWPEQGSPWGASGLSGGASFSYQEVANDAWVWSLSVSPHWSLPPWGRANHHLIWSVSVFWTVVWYERPWSVGSGLSTGSGVPWVWTATGSREW